MKLSIWQQFSSNHSSYFTVVGEFVNSQEAETAAKRLQAFFDTINEWFNQPENTALNQEREESDTAAISLPEQEISQDLGIDWYEYSIDWLRGDYKPIFLVDRFVIVQPGQSWQGGGPLAKVLIKFGGKGMVDGNVSDFDTPPYENHSLDIKFSCQAPSKEAALAINDEIREFRTAFGEYIQMLQEGRAGRMMAPMAPWVMNADRYEQFAASYVTSLEVVQNNADITFSKIGFHHLGTGFAMLVYWLQGKGCADFRYKIDESDITEDDDADFDLGAV